MRIAFAALLLAIVLLPGCLLYEAQDFGEWVVRNYDPAIDTLTAEGRTLTITEPDGSTLSREIPEDITPDDLQRIVVGARRSIETGSPWPAVFGVAGTALSILAGLFAKKKSDEARATGKQRDAAIVGIKLAPVDDGAKRAVAETIQLRAVERDVEHGKNGLAARVAELNADVT